MKIAVAALADLVRAVLVLHGLEEANVFRQLGKRR